MTDASEKRVVLVVDDEPDLADLYAEWLEAEYEVRVAHGGREALDHIDEEVDIVLLDRRMPDVSGDEVLDEIRSRGLDPWIALVTAVDPDFDILSMEIDDYLVKPVDRDVLFETIDGLLTRADYDETLQEYFSLSSKKAVLEAEKTAEELADSEEYARLEAELAEARERATAAFDDLDPEDFEMLFRRVDGEFEER